MAEWTTQEVAAFLSVDDGFVRRLRLAGRLEGKRQIGPIWLYDPAVVRKFAKSWNRRPGTYDRGTKGRKPKAKILAEAHVRGKSGKAILKVIKAAAKRRPSR